MVYVLIGIVVLITLLAIILIAGMSKKAKQSGGNPFVVFEFLPNGQLMVCTGFPVTYEISSIRNIDFSLFANRRNYSGTFRIIFRDGKKSRPFIFDYSVIVRKNVWFNTRQNIEQATEYLMNELKARNIYCRIVH